MSKKLNEDEINEIIEMKNQHNDLSYLNNLDFSKILNKKMPKIKYQEKRKR